MKRVIHFTKYRYFGFVFSSILLVGGLIGTIARGGFNIGIDFQAGISEQVQIAPPAFELTYSGKDTMSLTISGSSLTVTDEGVNGTQRHVIAFANSPTLADIEKALEGISGITVTTKADSKLSSDNIVGPGQTLEITETPITVNVQTATSSNYIRIDQVREALSSLGSPLIQVIGNPTSQQFLIRVEERTPTENFQQVMSAKVQQLLGDKFGADTVVVQQSQYVGPRFSQNLAQQAITLTLLSLLLIMVYIWIRFRLAYAVAAAIATIHDPLVMIGFIGVTQLEVNTATIAAVLTIVGYSLNDTVVVFDRIRENRGLMRESDLPTIIDTSITQVLSRTIITSLVTALSVLAILIFTTGSIQEFSLNMIVGIVIGTYSSIFIAAQTLLIWENVKSRRQARINAIKYGTHELALKMAGGGDSSGAEGAVVAGGPGGDNNKSMPEIIIPHAERKLHGKRRKKK